MQCRCRKPDITIFETCRGCGDPVNFEDLRQKAINTYDRDGRPIEDPNLSRRHLVIGNPRNSLRVLHLDDDASPILSGTFELVSITKLPEYEAVSYCWGGDDGDYTKSEFIIIGGALFPITKNCAAVLRKIREANSKRLIWIDSLCINQNDVNERSVQVSQMGKIFSGAQKVHIYVGNNVDDKTASKALHVLSSTKNLHEFSMRLRDRAEALKALFTQPYFSRMWIIQEVLLARSATLHWGTATIPWQTLSEDHLEGLKKFGIDNYVPEWMRIQATTHSLRNSETLGELLFSAMGATASNDRDKVYGIYGLLFDSEEEGLTVDYLLSVKQVFRNMAAHLIRKHNALPAVLRHVDRDAPPVDGEQLPSWVPDFRSRCVPKYLSIPFDGFSDLKIRSSVSSEEVVSSIGTSELCLRGHRLRIFQNERQASTEHFKSVFCKIGEQQLKWEIRSRFQVAFDADEHIVFWISNGLLLHLKRHPVREDTYTLLGECAIKHSGPFPTLVVHNRRTSFADAMFGLELQDLTSLWKVYTDFKSFLHGGWERDGYRPFRLPDTRMGREDANKAVNEYRSFCSREVFNGHRQQTRDEQAKGGQRQWMFGLREVQKSKDKRRFYRRKDRFRSTFRPIDSSSCSSSDEMSYRPSRVDQLPAKIKRMFDFESFWEDERTWKTLRSLNTVLQYPSSYDTRKITSLCESWLQHYDKAESLIKQFLGETDQDTTTGTGIPEELEAWEMTTEKLSEALQWAEGSFWPFEEPPSVQVWGSDEDSDSIPAISERRKAPNDDNGDGEVGVNSTDRKGKLEGEWPDLQSESLTGMLGLDSDNEIEGSEEDSPHDKGRLPDWVIKNNFKGVRLRLNEFEAGKGYRRSAGYVLQPWSDGWAEAIRSIPHFFAAKDQLNMEKLLQMEESCLKRAAWRMENMEICQAETITIV